eukprot:735860-Prymnesium_polylepis.1
MRRTATAETSMCRAFRLATARSNSCCAAGDQQKEAERRMLRLDATRRSGPPEGGRYSRSSPAMLASESSACGALTVRLSPLAEDDCC